MLSDDELARIPQLVAVIFDRTEDDDQGLAETSRRAALLPTGGFEVVPGGHEPWLDDLEPCADRVLHSLS